MARPPRSIPGTSSCWRRCRTRRRSSASDSTTAPTCKEVADDEALEAVAGYTLLNDLSARDLQFATPQWMPAGASDAIEFELELNGEVMQKASTSDLIFSVSELVSHLSRLMTLQPGDLVATGTPSGVGSVRQPRVWLQPGDEIVISSPTLGRLETGIAR